MRVNWVGAEEVADKGIRATVGAQRGLGGGGWRKPGSGKETGRGGRPGLEGPAGLGAASFLPSHGYGKWTWSKLGVKFPSGVAGRTGHRGPRTGAGGAVRRQRARTVSGAAAAARLAGVLFPARPPGREELEPKPDAS